MCKRIALSNEAVLTREFYARQILYCPYHPYANVLRTRSETIIRRNPEKKQARVIRFNDLFYFCFHLLILLILKYHFFHIIDLLHIYAR